jgi:POTRA domain, FtsQ-type/Cell division protein FtsQ
MNYRNHDFQDMPDLGASGVVYRHKINWFSNTKLIRIISKFMHMCSFICIFLILGLYIIQRPYFKIQHMNIHSPNIDINLNTVQTQLGIKQYSFFSLSLDQMRNVFEHLPSVKSANITRKYPDTLDVYLEKHTPFAYWGSEENTYVNADGVVYVGSNIEKNVRNVYLSGDNKDAKTVINQYAFLNKIFNQLVVSLTQTAEGNWIVILSNPIEPSNLNLQNIQNNNEIQKQHSDYLKITLGRDDQMLLAKKIVFWQKSWQKLKQQPEYAQVNTFDLRYDGFSMRKTMQKITVAKQIRSAGAINTDNTINVIQNSNANSDNNVDENMDAPLNMNVPSIPPNSD